MFKSQLMLTTLTFFVLFAGDGVASTTNSKSVGRDQYPNRGETRIFGPSNMATTPTESATDRMQELDRDSALMRILSPKEPASNQKKKLVRKGRKTSRHNRPKRGYYPYNPRNQPQLFQFEGLDTWKTSFYPIQRPYFVPMYGYDGRIPLYYPPCTYYHNSGTPQHNPNKPPYVGPTYLPPVTTVAPSATNETTMMPIDDRFGDNDDDERPIWDNDSYYPGRGTTPRSSLNPTRRPASRTTTVPPLVHRETAASSDPENPAPAPSNIPRPQGPSKCVWAIVSCCSTSSRDVSYECFDQLGCGGPFWDVNPCDTEYAKAAIQSALNYYNTRF